MDYKILLYYKYVTIDDPEEFANQHRKFCQELGVKGRIIIAREGINGTISGTIDETNKYMDYMHSDPKFKDMVFKIDKHDGHAFKKLFVRPKEELVTWRLEKPVNPALKSGKRLSPKEWKECIENEDVLIIDGRNDYEYDIGHFKGAIRPNVKTTREFPEWILSNLQNYKDKKILTYCTGGIRCEILSAFMLEEGFNDVSQLDGGIVSYGKDEDTKGEHFKGKCYVFDERISIPINPDDPTIVGKCYHCDKNEDRYINCDYSFCNRQHICCTACEDKYNHYCSLDCEEKDLMDKEG